MTDLGKIKTTLKTGNEKLFVNGSEKFIKLTVKSKMNELLK